MDRFALKKNTAGTDDLYLVNGRIARASGNEAIRQGIITRLRTFMGEYYLDQNYGLPYYQKFFSKPTNIQFFDSIVKKNILAVSGVSKILSYQSNVIPSSRTYQITCSVEDDDGAQFKIQFSF